MIEYMCMANVLFIIGGVFYIRDTKMKLKINNLEEFKSEHARTHQKDNERAVEKITQRYTRFFNDFYKTNEKLHVEISELKKPATIHHLSVVK